MADTKISHWKNQNFRLVVLLGFFLYVITNLFYPIYLNSLKLPAPKYQTNVVQVIMRTADNSSRGNNTLERSPNFSKGSSQLFKQTKGINIKTYINPNAIALVDLQTSGNVRKECHLEFDCTLWKFTDNSSQLKFPDFDSIVAMSKNTLLHNELQSSYRDPKQIWVFASPESRRLKYMFSNLRPIQDQFNWTYMISHNAEIFRKHFYLRKRATILTDEEQLWPNKNLKEFEFCWIFSNCNDALARSQTAKLLARYLDKPLHWWGMNDKDRKCIQPNDTNIEYHGSMPGRYRSYYGHNSYIKKCKFYLSLESAYCEDYLTEKFLNPLEVGAIPIVNGFRKSYDDHAPPNSFIHVFDFPNMRDLAKHLNELVKDESKMLNYHKWRHSYEVQPLNKQPICELCRKVEKAKKAEPGTWTMENVARKFDEDQVCILPDEKILRSGKLSDEEKLEYVKQLLQQI